MVATRQYLHTPYFDKGRKWVLFAEVRRLLFTIPTTTTMIMNSIIIIGTKGDDPPMST
jgi:hypothetical protein